MKLIAIKEDKLNLISRFHNTNVIISKLHIVKNKFTFNYMMSENKNIVIMKSIL